MTKDLSARGRRLAITAGPVKRVAPILAIALVLTFEAYALFVKRSGETSYLPPESSTGLSAEVAGETTLTQTFVMDADGLDTVVIYAAPAAGPPRGTVELTLLGDTYQYPLAKHSVPAPMLLAAPFEWRIPRVDGSAGRVFTLQIALPGTMAGQGLRFQVGPPGGVQGDLLLGGRQVWGDLKFRTRAARAVVMTNLGALRRQAPPFLRSDALLVVAAVLFNAALICLTLAYLPSGAGL